MKSITLLLVGLVVAVPFWVVFAYTKIPEASITVSSGLPGKTGPAGFRGALGARGPTGAKGPQGPKGLKGLPGITGPSGPIGHAGPTGSIGATGPVGATGPTSLIGGLATSTTTDINLTADYDPVYVNFFSTSGFDRFVLVCATAQFQLDLSPVPSTLPFVRFFINNMIQGTTSEGSGGFVYTFQDITDTAVKTVSACATMETNVGAGGYLQARIGAETSHVNNLVGAKVTVIKATAVGIGGN